MAKSANQKSKLLYLSKILLEQTDEDHPITVPEMIQELAKRDIKAERKSIYDDLETLSLFGLDVQSRKGRSPGWFIGSREFELPELKLLMDAVQSSRFITQKKSDALIRKLEGLASIHQARQLQRQVYVSGRIKVMNESIYYNVDRLHGALSAQKAITFKYFDYDISRQKVFRRDGKRYTVSPYGLIWDNENYYLVAFDHVNQEMRHYRVDKMAEITVTGLPRDMEHAVDMAHYAQKHFGMFSGREAAVRLRCRASLAGVVLDRFGYDVILVPDGEDWFTVTLDVVVSPQFWGWVFGLGEGVQVLGPEWARAEFQARLSAVARTYET